MQYYDQHLHTYFSPDSREEFENYLQQTDGFFVSTEHTDYYSPAQSNDDVILDFEGYSNRVAELNSQYNNRLLKGIEVGFTFSDREKIKAYLNGKDFDIIILSIHHNGRHGFMTLNHDTRDLNEHLEEYFGLMLQGIKEATYANVLAHFDFGLRGYDDVTVEELAHYEGILTDILKQIIANEQALELNTRSMYRYGNAHLYDYVIGLYVSLGGKHFTVSSDAHVAADYRLRFNDAFAMLRKHGVKQLTVYQKQKPILVDIPDV